MGDPDDPWVEIVGVVGATRNRGLDRDPEPELFASTLQLAGFNNQMFLVVRTGEDPYGVLPGIRAAVRALDAEQPVYAVRTVDEAAAQSQLRRRFSVILPSLFGAFALVLAAVGVYDVVSYATAQRTREVGVRMALGARRSDVVGLFVRQAMVPVTIGAGLGLVAAFGIGRAMASLLFEVRASRLDPVRALRRE